MQSSILENLNTDFWYWILNIVTRNHHYLLEDYWKFVEFIIFENKCINACTVRVYMKIYVIIYNYHRELLSLWKLRWRILQWQTVITDESTLLSNRRCFQMIVNGYYTWNLNFIIYFTALRMHIIYSHSKTNAGEHMLFRESKQRKSNDVYICKIFAHSRRAIWYSLFLISNCESNVFNNMRQKTTWNIFYITFKEVL